MEISRNNKYSDMQEVASGISGYGHDEYGAKCDAYYDLESKEEKLKIIIDYAMNVYAIKLSEEQVEKIFVFLEGDFEGEAGLFYAFEELK